MGDYFKLSQQELLDEKATLEKTYADFKALGLKLNMARGKPGPEQLDLSMDMLKMDNYTAADGTDARNYGMLEGLPEARAFFAELLGVQPAEVFVAGNSSLQTMYSLVSFGYVFGFVDSPRPWGKEETAKFLCPVPGYDRHFRITQEFGIEMINVPISPEGPDMAMIERLVKEDPSIKGMWCVPQYTNPDGYVYSDETIRRLAAMKTAAPDFRIFWDEAYIVHHLTDEVIETANLLEECKKAGNPERAFMFCSTSKITFPGAGVSAFAASETNMMDLSARMLPMVISYDKMNQLRHVRFLKDKAGVLAHMRKHAAMIAPKFKTVEETFAKELTPCGGIAHWTDPKGGYFISLYVKPGCAKRVAQLCKECGMVLTGAGASYPYGTDPQDEHLRIAPTYPSLDEVEKAALLLSVCVRLATVEKLLAQ